MDQGDKVADLDALVDTAPTGIKSEAKKRLSLVSQRSRSKERSRSKDRDTKKEKKKKMPVKAKKTGKGKKGKKKKAGKGKKKAISAAFKRNLGVPSNMWDVAVVPPGCVVNEWLALNAVDFFNECSLMYDCVVGHCTASSCPVMGAKDTLYLYSDGAKIKKPEQRAAPDYVDLASQWITAQMSDPSKFPVEVGDPFPKNFPSIIKKTFRHLFRIYAHMYMVHMNAVVKLHAETYLNSAFKHLVHFMEEFGLLDVKDTEPCKTLLKEIMDTDVRAEHLRPEFVLQHDTDDEEGEEDE